MTIDNSVPELKAFAERVAMWRSSRAHSRSAIPSELWGEAARLARAHSVRDVVKLTGLNSTHLKQRLYGSPKRRKMAPKQSFIPISLPSTAAIDQVELEVETIRGDKLRLKASGLDVASILERFVR